MVDLHPVKEETFDIAAGTNTDPKGFIRDVDHYHETPFGLYMRRGANHPRFGYLESWLLPELNLRANIFHFRPHVDEVQDFYVDIASIRHEGNIWRTRDLYVDLVSSVGTQVEVLDVDELAAACSAGLLSAQDTEIAIESTLRAVDGITRHNDDPMAWLSTLGCTLTWAQDVILTPAEE